MLLPFYFAPLPKIVFGPSKLNELSDYSLSFGKNTLLLTGRGSLIKSGRLDSVKSRLEKEGAKVFIEKIESEPSPLIIDTITAQYHTHNIQVVIAIGGGSVLDAGKTVSAMLPLNEPVKTYLEGIGTKTPEGRKIPFIAIPTTSGTGSETTKNAVISEIGPNGYKKSLRHDNYIPNVAIIDPELTLDCPPEITAASGMDAFSQLLESYLSPICDEMTSALVYSGIKAIERSLVRVFENGNDLDARIDMSYAAMISGIGLANAGLGVIHGFASPLGGFFEIPHGVVCGTLMAVCNKHNLLKSFEEQNQQVIEKYKKITECFFGTSATDFNSLSRFIDLLYEFTEKLGIQKLSKYGVREIDIERVVNETSNKSNPVKHTKTEMINILKERI